MAQHAGASRRCNVDPVDGAWRKGTQFFSPNLRRRYKSAGRGRKSKGRLKRSCLCRGHDGREFPQSPRQSRDARGKREKNQKWANRPGAVGSIIFALGFNILLFIVAPLVLTNVLFIGLGWAAAPTIAADAGWLETIKAYVWKIKLDSFGSWVSFNLIDGLIRMVFFIFMIFTMSFLKDIRRVFEYHGAEHKTVFTWEKGLDLTPENATTMKRQHPRCGTSFLMVVMLVAIVLFSVINFEVTWINLVVRIALMPLVAGLSYEVIRYAAKKESGAIFKLMTLPGLWLQNITTQEPDEEQLEVAIKALDESLKLEPRFGCKVVSYGVAQMRAADPC